MELQIRLSHKSFEFKQSIIVYIYIYIQRKKDNIGECSITNGHRPLPLSSKDRRIIQQFNMYLAGTSKSSHNHNFINYTRILFSIINQITNHESKKIQEIGVINFCEFHPRPVPQYWMTKADNVTIIILVSCLVGTYLFY